MKDKREREREREHELEQQFQPSKTHVCTDDQRAQNGESRKSPQGPQMEKRDEGIVEGEDVAGTECETTARQNQGCRKSLVTSVKMRRTRNTNLNHHSTIKTSVCATSPTNG